MRHPAGGVCVCVCVRARARVVSQRDLRQVPKPCALRGHGHACTRARCRKSRRRRSRGCWGSRLASAEAHPSAGAAMHTRAHAQAFTYAHASAHRAQACTHGTRDLARKLRRAARNKPQHIDTPMAVSASQGNESGRKMRSSGVGVGRGSVLLARGGGRRSQGVRPLSRCRGAVEEEEDERGQSPPWRQQEHTGRTRASGGEAARSARTCTAS